MERIYFFKLIVRYKELIWGGLLKVLVTGGAGFIGSHIVDELLKNQYEVVVVDNLVTGHKRNIPKGVHFYDLDICEDLDQLFLAEQPDFVIHHAAQVSVTNSIKDPGYDGKENIIGTINLLQACVKHKVQKLIYASTAALYGNPIYLPIDETHPVEPISFYGLSKWNAESYIQLYSRLFGLHYVILRYANVYGMRQDKNGEAGVVSIFIDNLLQNKQPNVYGDGLQTRDFIFVKDVAKANIAALTRGNNEVINISTQKEWNLVEMIEELSLIFKHEVSPIYQSERKGDIKNCVLSNSRAKTILKWSPEYPFASGLRETVEYYQENMDQLELT